MSGVIDENGQWEHCNRCGEWVLVQDLEYGPKDETYPYGRDLCHPCYTVEYPNMVPPPRILYVVQKP
jgi:hypothetical protein